MWNLPHKDVETLQYKTNVLSGFCDRNNRDLVDVEISLFNQVALAETDEEAEKLHKSSVWRSMPAIIGSPDTVASKMGECLDIGVDMCVVGFLPYHNKESTLLFTEEVIPLL